MRRISRKIKTRIKAKSAAKAKKPCAEDIFKQIQVRAYELYEKKGCQFGNEWQDWLEAEKQVKKELKVS